MSYSGSGPNPRRVIMLVMAAVAMIVALFCTGSLMESVDAGDIMVVQAPLSGNLTWHTTPGIKWQGFGEVTTYRKRGQFSFYSNEDSKDGSDTGTGGGAIKIRFNDGAHGSISGSLAYELPLDTVALTNLHSKYRSQDAIQQQLMRPVVEKSVYLTGPQMSSKESISEKRNDFLFLVEDQTQNGVFRTETVQQDMPDPITHQMKKVSVVQLARGKDGKYVRAEAESPLNEFGIKVFNLSLKEIKYDAEIEAQIKQQQEATMQVQLAIAKAKEAEQRAVTTAKEGEANAAKAKWEQEVIKTRAVTEAEQQFEVAVTEAKKKFEVAKFATQAAEQFKQTETLMGEGEGARRRANMEADGALDKRLETYLQVCKYNADAIRDCKVPLTPAVVMGNSGSGPNGGPASDVQALLSLFTVKAASDLGVNMNFNRLPQTASPPKAP